MLQIIQRLIQGTLQYGIGQAIIAFGAWIYVLILFVIAVYYVFFKPLLKFFSHH
jgi:hypothetical protein